MTDYHPAFSFLCTISSDIGLNNHTSDATVATIAGNMAQLSLVKTSDCSYEMNGHVLMSMNGLCSSATNPSSFQGYIQRNMMTASGASKVSLCMSSDSIVAYYLWNENVAP